MRKLSIGIILVMAIILSIFTMGMASQETGLDLNVGSAYLVDYNSGSVLYEKNAGERKPIASMVKIMTLLLTFEAMNEGKINSAEMVTISHEAAKQVGSELFIDENEKYSVGDLIKGITVVSANDASVAIAELLNGSESSFTSRMNERAKALGMNDTLFANCTGYPSQDEQYSTARDVSIMTRALLSHDEYYRYSTVWLEDYTHPSGRVTQLANTNKLIRHYKGCDSGKTGYTDSAKYCLSASASRDGMRVVATVLGAGDSKVRFNAVSQMFNYSFNNYKSKMMVKAGDPIGQAVHVNKAKVDSIIPIASQSISALINRNNKEWKVEYELKEGLTAPIKRGDILGVAYVVVDGSRVSSVDVVSGEDIAKATFWDYVKKITTK